MAAVCNSWHLALPGTLPPATTPRKGEHHEHRSYELGLGELVGVPHEGLVLMTLADACSHDDGTGCWPSAATIARALTSATAPSAARSPGCRLTARWSCTAAAAGATNSHTVVTGTAKFFHARMTCTREAPASLDPPNAQIR